MSSAQLYKPKDNSGHSQSNSNFQNSVIADNRSSTRAQLQLQQLMHNSPQLVAERARQTAPGSVPVLQNKIIEEGDSDTPLLSDADSLVQMAIGKNKKRPRKSTKTTKNPYGGCLFNAHPLTVKNAIFFDRPPSNSRRGQGDHVVSYSLITQAVATSVNGKALDVAGAALAELLGAAKEFVGPGAINKWWHDNVDNLIGRLNGIDPAADEDTAKLSINRGVNDLLFLLNTMPGTAMKNKKSTKGHGEGGSKGGIYHAEQQVKAGRVLTGNVWVNVLNLFDGAADKSLMQNAAKLDEKLAWLMALFSRAAPTVYNCIENGDLTLLPNTDLSAAVNQKFSAIDAIGVWATIQAWIDS
jgi:hypothetical protein